MAIGSNTLGLLFKIGIDPADAKKVLTDLRDSFVDGLGKGAQRGAKDAQKAIEETTSSLNKLGTTLQQTRSGFEEVFSGDVVEGAIRLTRSLGAVGLALAAVAAGLLAAYEAAKQFMDAVDKIGTRSKDDFEELQRNLVGTGLAINETQRALSQGITAELNKISAIATALFGKIIEEAGPALILLLKDVGKLLVELGPVFEAVGKFIGETLAKTIALIRLAKEDLKSLQEDFKDIDFSKVHDPFSLGEALGDAFRKKFEQLPKDVQNDAFKLGEYVGGKVREGFASQKKSFGEILKEVQSEIGTLQIPPSSFDPTTGKAKTTLAATARIHAAFEEARRLAEEERQRIAVAEDKELIDRDERASQLVDIEERLFLAQKKRIEDERDLALKSAKTEDARAAVVIKAENDIANARTATDIKTSQIFERRDKENEAQEKQVEALGKRVAENQKKLADEISDLWFHAALDINNALTKALDVKPEEGGGVTAGIIQGVHAQAAALGPMTKAWREAKFALDEWLQSAAQGKEGLGGLTEFSNKFTQSLEKQINAQIQAGQSLQAFGTFITNLPFVAIFAFANAFQKLLDTFIETGKTGPAVLKELVAGVLRAIAEMAAGFSAFAFALSLIFLVLGQFHKAAIAAIAGVAFAALAIGLGFAANKIAPSQAAATATGGTFGGDTTVAPGTVTINQGVAATTLGIQAQTLAVLSDMNNKLSTASPGDVVTRGANQNPLAIGQANNEAARRDGTVSRQFLEIAGLRPA